MCVTVSNREQRVKQLIDETNVLKSKLNEDNPAIEMLRQEISIDVNKRIREMRFISLISAFIVTIFMSLIFVIFNGG